MAEPQYFVERWILSPNGCLLRGPPLTLRQTILGADFYCVDFGETLVHGGGWSFLRCCEERQAEFCSCLLSDCFVASHPAKAVWKKYATKLNPATRAASIYLRAIGSQADLVLSTTKDWPTANTLLNSNCSRRRVRSISRLMRTCVFEEAFAIESGLPGTLNANEMTASGLNQRPATMRHARIRPQEASAVSGGRSPCRTAVPTGT